MPLANWKYNSRRSYSRTIWPWVFVFSVLILIRLSKGIGIIGGYALLTRPFWPGAAQREWLQKASNLEQASRILILEADNRRLRYLLGLTHAKPLLESAPVISRQSSRWWQELELGKGKEQNLNIGNVVMGPGGLIGHILSVSQGTAKVQLLTDPNSQVGVWVSRTRCHGLLIGTGTNQPLLRFLEKDPSVKPGDVVTTSPYSILVPPNLPVGVLQYISPKSVPVTEAGVKLLAPIDAIDWVQVQLSSENHLL